MAKPVGLWGAYVMGLAFAFGWTPCIGPILAAILAVAASEADGGQGRGPARGLFARPRHSVHRRGVRDRAVRGVPCALRSYLPLVEKAMGALLVLTGIAFLTGIVNADERLAAGDVSGARARSAERSKESPPRGRASRTFASARSSSSCSPSPGTRRR